jgi:putative transposase
MPINPLHKAEYTYESFYHVYNRSVSNQKLFFNDQNYIFFLKKFDEYLSDLLKIYSWCLIPNHFHFLISIKPASECKFNSKEKMKLQNSQADINELVSTRFKNFFISYSISIKNEQGINTNIFAQHYKHILIGKDDYFSQLIYYIHFNPLKHGITKNWKNYRWSSYKRLVSEVETNLQTRYVLDWFGGRETFVKYHELQQKEYECNFEDL